MKASAHTLELGPIQLHLTHLKCSGDPSEQNTLLRNCSLTCTSDCLEVRLAGSEAAVSPEERCRRLLKKCCIIECSRSAHRVI